VAQKYGDALAELTEIGDELGLHTHVWRWETTAGEWFADLEDPAWAEHWWRWLSTRSKRPSVAAAPRTGVATIS